MSDPLAEPPDAAERGSGLAPMVGVFVPAG